MNSWVASEIRQVAEHSSFAHLDVFQSFEHNIIVHLGIETVVGEPPEGRAEFHIRVKLNEAEGRGEICTGD